MLSPPSIFLFDSSISRSKIEEAMLSFVQDEINPLISAYGSRLLIHRTVYDDIAPTLASYPDFVFKKSSNLVEAHSHLIDSLNSTTRVTVGSKSSKASNRQNSLRPSDENFTTAWGTVPNKDDSDPTG